MTSDTGPVGDMRLLADELQAQHDTFAHDTAGIEGCIGVCLRSLPSSMDRRSFTRFDRRDDTLSVDLTVSEELLAGATIDQQRELVGRELHALLVRGLMSRTAPWTADQRSRLSTAIGHVLITIFWVNGRRERGERLLSAGHSLTGVSDDTGLPLAEVEDLYVDMVART